MIKPWNWETAAKFAERVYGTRVDWEERFFICPECDDVVYECDWENEDLSICPICEYRFYKDMDDGK